MREAREVLRAEADGQRTLARARWGLTPPWLTDLSRTPAHARAETVAEQPMFREALRLYPPVPMMVRQNRCPVHLRGRKVGLTLSGGNVDHDVFARVLARESEVTQALEAPASPQPLRRTA